MVYGRNQLHPKIGSKKLETLHLALRQFSPAFHLGAAQAGSLVAVSSREKHSTLKLYPQTTEDRIWVMY